MPSLQTSRILFILTNTLAATFLPAAPPDAIAAVPQDSPLRRIPTVVAVPVDRLPQAQLLGTPKVRVLLGYTRRLLRLPDGHTFAVFSYSNSAPANWIFLINGRDLSVQRFSVPNNDIASHGAALGKDGHIYIMPYDTGRAYRFNAQAYRFEHLQVPLPQGEFTWDAFGASNGRIYFGTYPNAYFCEYDPVTGNSDLRKQVAPSTKYATDFSEDERGCIRFKAWGPDQIWMTFDPMNRTLTASEQPKPPAAATAPIACPLPPDGDERFQRQITVQGRRFAMSFPTSRLWELTSDGKARFRGDPNDPAVPFWWLEPVEGALVGIGYFGTLFRYDLTTGQFLRHELPNRAPAGNSIMFLESVTPRCVIGANYSQQNLFRIDPETGKIDQCDFMVARVSGEPMCAVGFGGKAWLGIYVSSILSVYDPSIPFAFGTNPRELIELGGRYQQTRPRDAVSDGRLVYISSDSAYNHLGGALAVIDPNTEDIDVYHHLIKDQNLPTLACDPLTGLIWGGSDRWGQMRSHPPTQPDSLIYAFDPQSRKVVATLTPWRNADTTSVLGISNNGILVAAGGGQIALIETATRQILYQGKSPVGIPSRVRRAADGLCYCLSEGTLYRWNLTGNILAPVGNSPGCHLLTEPMPETWLLADGASIYRVRLPRTKQTR